MPVSLFECWLGDIANFGGGSQRAQVVGNPNSGFSQRRLEWFNVSAFDLPAPYTFGNEGRNNMTGAPVKNVDFITYKDFHFAEKTALQFRAEFFNIFDHANSDCQTITYRALVLAKSLPRLLLLARSNLRSNFLSDVASSRIEESRALQFRPGRNSRTISIVDYYTVGFISGVNPDHSHFSI